MPRRSASPPMPRLSASTVLDVVALNVGMIAEDAFQREQPQKIHELASFIAEWFRDGVAAVGLNEIHESIARKCLDVLCNSFWHGVEIATQGSDALLWCAPQRVVERSELPCRRRRQ